jgi:multicomponent Na+:H+ antiporter subunit D
VATTFDLSDAMAVEPVGTAGLLVVAPVLVTLLGGGLCLVLRHRTAAQPWIAGATLLLLAAANAVLLHGAFVRGPVTVVMGNWLPPFGIAFTVDVLGAGLAFAASLVALVVTLASVSSINAMERRYGFYALLLVLMTGVEGAFLTGDVFNLYVWFEVLLISSFGLMVIGSSRLQLDGTLKYAVLNLVATTLFLVATALLYGALGTLNMADIALKARAAAEGGEGAPLVAVAGLFFLAFAIKAAAFPVGFWLPASYHTPHVVVSALMAGLMTKVGVYALLRVLVMLLPVQAAAFSELVVLVAGATMIFGALGALAQADIRRMLGFLVVSGVGYMLAGLAIGTAEGLAGAIFYLIHSMLVTTGLYLVAGLAGRAAGGYDLNAVGGLYAVRPGLSAMFLVLGLAVAGLPPFSGFWPKLFLFDAAYSAGETWLATAVLVAGFLTTLVIGRTWLLAFWRPPREPSEASAPDSAGFAATLVLVAGVVVLGFVPDPVYRLAGAAAAGILDPTAYLGSVFGAAP